MPSPEIRTAPKLSYFLSEKKTEHILLLEIRGPDHIIFTDNSYFSFADENML